MTLSSRTSGNLWTRPWLAPLMAGVVMGFMAHMGYELLLGAHGGRGSVSVETLPNRIAPPPTRSISQLGLPDKRTPAVPKSVPQSSVTPPAVPSRTSLEPMAEAAPESVRHAAPPRSPFLAAYEQQLIELEKRYTESAGSPVARKKIQAEFERAIHEAHLAGGEELQGDPFIHGQEEALKSKFETR